jgi:DNA-binding transcriptional ArsR family regulator
MHQDRPVTPEVAGSSPVAPVNFLQIAIFCCRAWRKRPPVSFHLACIPHGNPGKSPLRVADSRELLALVAAYGPICVCHSRNSCPTASTLRRAGLVSSRREGAWVYYETSDEMLAVAHEFLEQLGTSVRTPHEADLCADPDKA